MDTKLRGSIPTGILAPIGITRASGCVIYALDTQRYCWQLRSLKEKYSGTWGLWGGRSHNSESPKDTLLRECQEEVGLKEWNRIIPLHRYISKDKNFIYDTFCIVVENEFLPILNYESDGYCWLPIKIYPKPLHHKSKQLIQSINFINKLSNMEKWLDQYGRN